MKSPQGEVTHQDQSVNAYETLNAVSNIRQMLDKSYSVRLMQVQVAET